MKTYILPLCALLSACGEWQFPHNDGPVMAYEMQGMWCTKALPEQTCLIADGIHDSYIWYVGNDLGDATCTEAGRLSGGLEFTPDTDSRLCLAPEYELYSAAGEWTATGLRLTVDTLPAEQRARRDDPGLTLDLDYVP